MELKNNTLQLSITLLKIVLFIYMEITLLPTTMIKKSYHYMMAVGNLIPLRADLMHYVMSLPQVLEYFKKTGNWFVGDFQNKQLKIL